MISDLFICPACGSSSFQPYLACIDHALTKESFNLMRCDTCTLVATSPRPAPAEMDRYYQFPAYISHSGKSNSTFTDKLYKVVRYFALRWKRKIIERETINGRILDVGCGTGEFLSTMKKAGWETDGMEPSAFARTKAQTFLQKLIYTKIEELPHAAYDVITLWHVLEHVTDPVNTIQQLKKKLKAGGIICIAVPNHNAYDAQKYGAAWAGYDVPRHLWHFNPKSMDVFLKKNNLTLIRKLPMMFDASYVSLLSEQYTHPAQRLRNYLRALCTGIVSNIKARRQFNYSSILFMAKFNP